jgi:hypothetical protein
VWFSDDDADIVARVHRRIARVTGLSLDTAEALQVGNCLSLFASRCLNHSHLDGMGGHYEPHYDYGNPKVWAHPVRYLFGIGHSRLRSTATASPR